MLNAQLDESKLQYRLVVLQNLLYHEELYVETLELLHQVRLQYRVLYSVQYSVHCTTDPVASHLTSIAPLAPTCACALLRSCIRLETHYAFHKRLHFTLLPSWELFRM